VRSPQNHVKKYQHHNKLIVKHLGQTCLHKEEKVGLGKDAASLSRTLSFFRLFSSSL